MKLVFVKVLTLNHRFNLLGLASSFLLFYTALSNNPWWTIYGAYGGIGNERTFSAEVSPFNISVEVLGKPVIVPMLFYLTMAARLSILLAAATTLSGSLLIKKPWSKPLISLRGLMLPLLFLAGLFVTLNLASSYANVSLPLIGRSTIRYTIDYGGLRIDTETAVEAALTQEYWIALTAGALSALAKAVHGRIAGDQPRNADHYGHRRGR
jgi:hypothetical protein